MARTFTEGQPVESKVTDFETPGFPTVWMLGTVLSVTPLDGGLNDVFVETPRGRQMYRTGPRGGGRIRNLTSA